MATSENTSRHDDVLNDSWEELSYKSQSSVSPTFLPKTSSTSSSVIEKLLHDAQRESSAASVASGSGGYPSSTSPRSLRSLYSESPPHFFEVDMAQSRDCALQKLQTTDWVWDWSSRPEINPPWAGSMRKVEPFRHPVSKRRTLSIRNSRLMQLLMTSLENLPFLLITHACTFILGAATMLVILKKYYRYTAVTSLALD